MVRVRVAASLLEAPPPSSPHLAVVWLTYNMYRREYVKERSERERLCGGEGARERERGGGGGGGEKENTSESEYMCSCVYSCVQECF